MKPRGARGEVGPFPKGSSSSRGRSPPMKQQLFAFRRPRPERADNGQDCPDGSSDASNEEKAADLSLSQSVSVDGDSVHPLPRSIEHMLAQVVSN